jgi:uncharacterized membrane protein YgcG
VSDREANVVRAGYRKVSVLLLIGLAGIGFTRFEDRAIIGVPGSPANAMAALAVSDETGPAESYSAPPDDSVSLGSASRLPTDRIRRVLREREVPVAASRQILATGGFQDPNAGEPQGNPGTDAAALQAFSAIEPSAPAFASLAPALPGQGSPVFAAPLPASGGGTGGGGTGGGGTGGGGDTGGGGENGGGGVVSPVPEPGTWLMLILGLFAIGSAMRQRPVNRAKRFKLTTG